MSVCALDGYDDDYDDLCFILFADKKETAYNQHFQ